MTAEGMAYWALIEHHRWWLATDGPNFAEVQSAGKLTESVSARIAREYGVARNIGAVADGDGAAIRGIGALIEEINASAWPESLPERAAICASIAHRHKTRCHGLGKAKSVHSPFSGVTKLMWFLRPEGWTMFDKFARIGLINRKNDWSLFYRTLDEDGFVGLAQSITALCRASDLPLHGERIIDKLLLFRGQETDAGVGKTPFAAARATNARHLELLPPRRRNELHALAEAVAAKLPDDSFKQRLSSRGTRKN